MEVQELARTIDNLNHYLIDVWDWNALNDIRREYVRTVFDIDNQRRGELESKRDISANVREHLIAKYAKAVDEADRVTALLRDVPSHIAEVLLEKVQKDLRRLGTGRECERQRTDHLPFEPDLGFQDDPTPEELEEYRNRPPEPEWHEEYPDHSEPWEFIASELGPFAERVADRIRDHRGHADEKGTVPEQETDPELLRIKWIPTTAVFIHLVEELVKKEYIEVPGRNSKEGEGNETELIRRLLQAFVIIGSKTGKPLTVEGLRQRFQSERKVAYTTGLRIELPYASEL